MLNAIHQMVNASTPIYSCGGVDPSTAVMGHLSTGVAFQPFSSIDLLQASEPAAIREPGRITALPMLPAGQGRGTCGQRDALPTCTHPAPTSPQGLRLRPDALRLPGYRLIPFSWTANSRGPAAERRPGAQPRGSGAARPTPWSALGAGGTPGAEGRRPPLPLFDPLWGSDIRYYERLCEVKSSEYTCYKWSAGGSAP